MAAPVRAWDVARVGQWLDEQELGALKQMFSESAVEGDMLLDLSAEELEASRPLSD